MPLSLKYVIPGNPASLDKLSYNRALTWCNSQESRLITRIHLEGQHTGPTITEPIHLSLGFYFTAPKRANSISHLFKNTPRLTHLIGFYQESGIGVIWESEQNIVKVSAYKMFSDVPRTEINILGM